MADRLIIQGARPWEHGPRGRTRRGHDEGRRPRGRHRPRGGEHRGEIVHSGTYKQLLKNPKSITGQYLSGKRKIEVPGVRRLGNGNIVTVKGARENNLKGIEVEVPLGKFVC